MYFRCIRRSLQINSQSSPSILWHCLAPGATVIRSPHIQTPICNTHPQRIAQSSLLGTAVIIIGTTTLCGSVYWYRRKHTPMPRAFDNEPQDYTIAEQDATMAGTAPPGRPGNLTQEQEARLQEMWTATLKVFGMSVLNDGSNGDTASITGSEAERNSRAETVVLEKKRKKRVGLFNRKHHDDTGSEDADGDSVMDGDDKYGQSKEFHKMVESQSPEDLRTAFWSMVKHDNPDGLLLRFLRARKWNVQNALIMLIATMHWRTQELHVDDDIIRRGEGGAIEDSASPNESVKKEGENFLAQMRLGKSFLHGTDKEGRPMCFVKVRLHKQGEQSEASLERFTVYTIETARLLLTSNVDTAVSIS